MMAESKILATPAMTGFLLAGCERLASPFGPSTAWVAISIADVEVHSGPSLAV